MSFAKRKKTAVSLAAKEYREYTITRIYTPIPPEFERVVDEYHTGYDDMARVRILYNPETDEYLYHIEEPSVDDYIQGLYALVRRHLESQPLAETPEEIGELERFYRKLIKDILASLGHEEAIYNRPELIYYLMRDILGWSIIDVPMRDPLVEEIDYSSPGRPFRVVVKHPQVDATWVDTNIVLDKKSVTQLILLVASKSGSSISESNPIMEAKTPEGYRVAANLEEVGRSPGITIRKFPERPLSLISLVKNRTMSPLVAAYLWTLVEAKRFIMVIGEMGSGKTTVLQALTSMIPKDEKVVTIEDARELNLEHPQWQALYTRYATGAARSITLNDLAKYSLRTRGQYIIMGEVRGEEIQTLVQMAASGHGAMTTFHASDPVTLFLRITSPPLSVQPSFILTISAIVYQQYVWVSSKGKKPVRSRRTSKIWEITGIKPVHTPTEIPVEYKLVFEWDPSTDTHKPDDVEELLDKSLHLRLIGINKYSEKYWRQMMKYELEAKVAFIKALAEKGITGYRETTEHVYRFTIELRKRMKELMDTLGGE